MPAGPPSLYPSAGAPFPGYPSADGAAGGYPPPPGQAAPAPPGVPASAPYNYNIPPRPESPNDNVDTKEDLNIRNGKMYQTFHRLHKL